MKSICFAITGAIYEHQKAIDQIIKLKDTYNILPTVSETSAKCTSLCKNLEVITSNPIIDSIYKAEPIGPKELSDALIICPCTGNTLAKIANSISDNTVTMLAKVHQRNNKPIVIALSSNDLLGLNMFNLAKLMNSKNFYFVPFYQDNPEKKPKSLKSDFDLLEKTLHLALIGKQIEPVITQN